MIHWLGSFRHVLSGEDHFRHEPLEEDGHCIRLVKILPRSTVSEDGLLQLELSNHYLGDGINNKVPVYAALSYTWGADEATQFIKINGASFKIRPNLFNFLKQMENNIRGLKPRPYLWIDSICIDQNHLEERNEQVQLMPKIYGQAEAVYTWLGEATENSRRGMRTLARQEPPILRTFTGCAQGSEPGMEEEIENMVAACELLHRPYWSRVWVVQELYFAKKIIVICGPDWFHLEFPEKTTVGGTVFGHLHSFFSVNASDDPDFLDTFVGNAIRSRRLPDLVMHHQDTPTQSRCLKWTEAVQLSYDRHCQDPRDHIFGIQACLKSVERVTVDYSLSADDVYMEFVNTVFNLAIPSSYTHEHHVLCHLRIAMGLEIVIGEVWNTTLARLRLNYAAKKSKQLRRRQKYPSLKLKNRAQLKPRTSEHRTLFW